MENAGKVENFEVCKGILFNRETNVNRGQDTAASHFHPFFPLASGTDGRHECNRSDPNASTMRRDRALANQGPCKIARVLPPKRLE